MIQQRKKANSSRVNLTISFIFHGVLILVVFFFAAREGMLGKKLKQLSVTMTREKKPEPPKERPREAKAETPKPEGPAAKVNVPPPKAVAAVAPPPMATVAAPAAAPAAASLPAFEFNDGAKEVQTLSDANGIYKALVEHFLRSRWERPEDIADEAYVAEIELSVDPKGRVTDSRWLRGSGDKRWDDSVRRVIAQAKTISRPPPKGFPEKFLVRFDVETSRTEPVLQANVR
jgi:TonB family protein